ncbi:MAG: ATP-binding cassette domain-containing protein [Patescibacteria group bacterium]
MPFQYTLAEPLLQVKNVHLQLGGKQILAGVNAEVRNITRPGLTQGQVVGFLGPSGVGKTQLFNLMAGLDPAARDAKVTGEILVAVSGSDKLVPVRRGLAGVVAQDYRLFEHRTVLSNLIVAARKGDYEPKERKAEAVALLERFNLAEHAGKYPAQLSGGQRQRVAIAQQLLCSTTVLLMDEPFSGLDPVMIDQVAKLINEVAALDEHMTIVVVTHDVSAAISVSDTLWLMGRDRDAKGAILPGAKIQTTYNLIDMDLAWHPDIQAMPAFHDLVREVKLRFRTL